MLTLAAFSTHLYTSHPTSVTIWLNRSGAVLMVARQCLRATKIHLFNIVTLPLCTKVSIGRRVVD